MQTNRLINGDMVEEDVELDTSLRPIKLKDFIGQNKVKESIGVFIEAAKKRAESIDHVLIYGGPGLGKTTLAHIIAKEMGVNIRYTSGPAIERVGDLASILTNLNKGDVLFIDEIHRLNRVIEESLYPAMEDFALDLVIGKGPSAKTLRLDLPPFTLIGATTRLSLISSPMRDRFGLIHHLDFYEDEDIEKIINRAAKILNIKIEKDAAGEISVRSRKTPRIANRLLKRIRDFAEVKGKGIINKEIAQIALDALEIDCLGLDLVDRRLLKTIIEKYSGGPVGLETLSAAIGEDLETISDVCEPYLIQSGLLQRTKAGRVVTLQAYKHLNIKKKNVSQDEMI